MEFATLAWGGEFLRHCGSCRETFDVWMSAVQLVAPFVRVVVSFL